MNIILLIVMMITSATKSENLDNDNSKKSDSNRIEINGMKVSWKHEAEFITFNMSAPTNGWVTIGFNQESGTTNSYLLMGNVINGKASVVEHFTISPGNYKTFSQLKVKPSIDNVVGIESNKYTSLTFRLPITANNKYARDLKIGQEYILILAYSMEDDFQHHSIIRTSTSITL